MPPTHVTMNEYDRRDHLAPSGPATKQAPLRYAGAGMRISLGVLMFWAFLDKLFGLGYSTKAANAWLNGGSPTRGFLGGTKGWFSGFFQAIAGNVLTDWLFMAALAGIGLALIFGVGVRLAGVSGAILMLLMYAAATVGVPGTSNPIVDDHIVYALLFATFAFYPVVGNTLGLGRSWQELGIVKKYRLLA